jgi:hypothetical protein
VLQAAMAVLSCFEHWVRPLVLERPGLRAAWSAVILFAALVPAALTLLQLPTRLTIAGAGALAVCAGLAVVPPFRRGLAPKALAGLGCAALAFGLLLLLAPLLPPVPVQCLRAATGTAVLDRQLQGEAEGFEAGIERVYAWFAVAAPDRFRQAVRFAWSHEGQAIGRPFETQVQGGRRAGFRTWAYFSQPWPGRWQVELLTDAGQLIAARSFQIYPEVIR